MKKTALFAALILAALTAPAAAQSNCPYIAFGVTLTAGQWNACFASKQDVATASVPGGINSSVQYNKSGELAGATGALSNGVGISFAASPTIGALNVFPGSAPATPNNGDVWSTTSGLFVQVNGAPVGPLSNALVTPVATVAALKALGTSSPAIANAFVQSYYASPTVGGGFFVWVSGTCTPDNGVWIAATGVADTVGCWHRILTGNFVIPEFWGAPVGTTNDSSPAWNSAIAFANSSGLCMVPGLGPYYLSEEVIFSADGNCINGQNSVNTTIIPTGTGNRAVFRIASSHNTIKNIHISNADGLSGLTPIRFAPLNEGGSSVETFANYNVIDNVFIDGSSTEGIVFLPGWSDSQCYFNKISNVWIVNALRSVWFSVPITGGLSGCNVNSFNNVNVLNFGGGTIHPNTGIEIDLGENENFTDGSVNGADYGTSPNATPTGIQVLNDPSNVNNKFDSLYLESNTLDWDIRDTATIGIGILGLTTSFPNGIPFTWLGNAPSAGGPVSVAGMVFQSNNQISAPNNTSYANQAASLTVHQTTVALLPATIVAGQMLEVTDANAACTAGTSPTGGGSTKCLVVGNGSAWKELGV